MLNHPLLLPPETRRPRTSGPMEGSRSRSRSRTQSRGTDERFVSRSRGPQPSFERNPPPVPPSPEALILWRASDHVSYPMHYERNPRRCQCRTCHWPGGVSNEVRCTRMSADFRTMQSGSRLLQSLRLTYLRHVPTSYI